MAKYKVTDKVPVPPMRAISARYPFADMSIGDSFFVPLEDVQTREQIRQSCYYYSRKNPKYRFTVVPEKNGHRVFRISLNDV